MKTTRSFDGMTDRYKFDFGAYSHKNGYAQVDTSQDASYYGTWTNPFKLVLFTYCEGDMTLQEAETVEEYVEMILNFKAWADGFGAFKGIDAGMNNGTIERFIELGLGDLLH